MTKFNQRYSIGLDIGVASVGYAVVTEDHRVPTFKFKVLGDTEKKKIKKNLIGSVTFEAAQTAQDTRKFRINSRRIERRNNRILYLRNIFKDEIDKVDKNFYHRLDETFRVLGDKSEDIRVKHPFFGRKDLEQEYHKKYPTIYHLRKALADSDENAPAADIREIYMALSHILKYRGHFLIDGKVNPNHIDIKNSWKEFLESCQEELEIEIQEGSEEIYKIFKEIPSRQDQAKEILSHFPKEEAKKEKSIFKQLLKLLLGLKTKFKDCFDLEEEPDLDFSKENYDENLESLLEILDEDFSDVFANLRILRDTLLLSDMLTYKGATHARFSATMIERYEEHRKDLQRLKSFVKQNLSEQDYRDIFGRKTQRGFEIDKESKGYAGYISNRMELKTSKEKSKSKQQNFYDYLSSKISDIEGSEYFLEKIKAGTFLRKLRTSDNGAIPNQIHECEFKAIIDRHGKDYPFLLENKEKLITILTFRIPYFVGPLSKDNNSQFAWVQRKEHPEILDSDDIDTKDGNIRPWNYDRLIDIDATRNKFINNLIGDDVVLLNEKVLPKRSLVYEEAMLQNELTRVKYKDKYGKSNHLNSELRQQIINDLFKTNSKRISSKVVLDYLQNSQGLNAVEIVAGIEKGKSFNSTLKTYNDFKRIFSRDFLDSGEHQKELEEIVKIITVFDDKKSIKDYLEKYFSELSEEQINMLSKLRYAGWGRYSAKLLLEIRDDDTGFNLLQFIRNDDRNRNLSQLMSDDELSFDSKIKQVQSEKLVEDDVFEEIKKLAGSPALKRGILNSIRIVDELVEFIGYPPQNIVIEMARENMTTKEGKRKSKSRKDKLETALKKAENDILIGSGKDRRLRFSNEQLQSEKLYLYCLQKGKDMYSLDESGNPEPLYLDQLDKYEIDHIIPYSYLPIDSIDNKVLTRRSNNQFKLDNIPDKKTVFNMKQFWEKLYEDKLISQIKFQRLTTSEHTPNGVLTEDMKAGFIERQLVETRQIIKHVARILDERFTESQIVTLKSQLVSNFRNMFHIVKLRDLNDYHHAHDAYLNVVIGQTLLKAYPKLAPELVYGLYNNFNRHRENKATLKKYIYSNVMRLFNNPDSKIDKDIWNCDRDLPIIKNVIYNTQINFVKRTMVKKGGFYNQNPVGKDNKKIAAANRYPLKTKGVVLNPEIYGGYGPVNSAMSAFVIAERFNEKKSKLETVKEFHDIYIIDYPKFKENPMLFLNDASENGFLTKNNLNRVLFFKKLPKYSLIQKTDGSRMMFESKTNLHKATQFKLTEVQSELFFHMKRLLTKSNFMNLKSEEAIIESQNYIMNHANEFDMIASHLFSYAEKQLGNKTVFKKAAIAYDKKMYQKIDLTEEVIKYYYDNFMKLFSLVKSGSSSGYVTGLFESSKIRNADYSPSKNEINATLIHQSITGLYETRIDLSKLGGD
ncbi:TPA: type II CRISPR RNA-guided endonuclease Cas9 [Streptococcus mutans]|uniref:type II CRISPR RNA-guided endonuclease Cas9 n=1 Tax=Streptococcus mutans TaxID=1309 RepID=UPI0014552F32|nr:type II CRISPR RNA-guided endonuclease Cas9 [Streptococcus mutans]MCB5112636.1 type II CRISPR RNA-guided endonuclease Cas9 [Streptococcus mutans]NLQ70062.1 type II CRISPR RNA-guided endonuclease Cas9 [Streptococcus mutans]